LGTDECHTTTAPLVVSAVIGMSLRADHAHCCSHCAIARGAVDARREKRGRDEGTGKVKHTCVGGVGRSFIYACGFSSHHTHTARCHPSSSHAASRSHAHKHTLSVGRDLTRHAARALSSRTRRSARGPRLSGLAQRKQNWFSHQPGGKFLIFLKKNKQTCCFVLRLHILASTST
jgi:hypothetical protein